MRMSRLIASAAFAALLAGVAVPLGGAQASVLYSWDFNSGFQGTQLNLSGDPVGNKSDRYATTNYYTINNAGGWTFSGSAYFALGFLGDGTNGAVLLNETTGAGTVLVGLAANTAYALSFTYWGDNRPGDAYVLNVSVNTSNVDTINGTDGAPGSNPGTTVTIPITSDGAGNIALLFSQASTTQASPIFDDVQISDLRQSSNATPLPAALPLFAGGLGVMGLLARRRKRKNAAVAAA